jgi:hypothetical protein
MVASLSFWMTGCSDDDDTGGGGTVVEDGLYVKGAGTDLRISVPKLYLKLLKMKFCKRQNNLLELYIPVKAGADGFNIVSVSGTTRKTYGPGAGFQNCRNCCIGCG